MGSAADLIFVTDDVDEAHTAMAERDVSFIVTDPDGLDVLIMQPR